MLDIHHLLVGFTRRITVVPSPPNLCVYEDLKCFIYRDYGHSSTLMLNPRDFHSLLFLLFLYYFAKKESQTVFEISQSRYSILQNRTLFILISICFRFSKKNNTHTCEGRHKQLQCGGGYGSRTVIISNKQRTNSLTHSPIQKIYLHKSQYSNSDQNIRTLSYALVWQSLHGTLVFFC